MNTAKLKRLRLSNNIILNMLNEKKQIHVFLIHDTNIKRPVIGDC